MRIFLIFSFFVLGSCNRPLEEEPPITRIILLGDSMLVGLGVDTPYQFRTLILDNHDEAYPDYIGKDLHSLNPDCEMIERTGKGASTSDAREWLTNDLDNPSGKTVVVYTGGWNDFAGVLLGWVSVEEGINRMEENLDAIAKHFAKERRFPDGAEILFWNFQDFSDGIGFLHPEVTSPLLTCALWPKEMGERSFLFLSAIEMMNTMNADLAGRYSHVHTIDVHSHFLGHGMWFFYNEAPAYHKDDPTLWYIDDCLHPNVRGNHEIRKLVWKKIEELYGRTGTN